MGGTENRGTAGRDIAIAHFAWRHEAEFAAGFLADAGIPYRMQHNGLGEVTSGPTTLWVRADDADEVRELLDLDHPGGALPRATPPESVPPSAMLSAQRRHGRLESPHGIQVRLCGVERAVAGMSAAVLFGVASGFGTGIPTTPVGAVWATGCGMIGLGLGLGAVTGRTIRPLKALLAALSGQTP